MHRNSMKIYHWKDKKGKDHYAKEVIEFED